MERPNPNSHWITEGKLLAGQFAGGFDPDGVNAELARFLDAGVRHFVDLTEPGEMGCYTEALAGLAKAQGLTVTYQRVPLRNAEVPNSAATMRQILDALELALAQDGVTYIHCWGGRGRTGLAVACWLQEQGRTPEEALAEVTRAWMSFRLTVPVEWLGSSLRTSMFRNPPATVLVLIVRSHSRKSPEVAP